MSQRCLFENPGFVCGAGFQPATFLRVWQVENLPHEVSTPDSGSPEDYCPVAATRKAMLDVPRFGCSPTTTRAKIQTPDTISGHRPDAG